MEQRLEVLPFPGRSRRNRRWPDEVKGRIVAETLKSGVSVADVARRHGVPANHISSWRSRAKKGALVLPAPEDPVEFASLLDGPRRRSGVPFDGTRSDPGGRCDPPGGERIRQADRSGRPGPGGGDMILPSNRVRIVVATKPIDFRKGHDSLAAMVKNELRKAYGEAMLELRARKTFQALMEREDRAMVAPRVRATMARNDPDAP